ncbi:hypothetical protein SETIT_3G341600v2 [Setaria italica]|uniref:Knottins-like domain-containing protein n=1 Tax=Setaria italica TaxID=4555 RepID=A0A368QLS0_SETIT|nr:hypothetical protein SETIT_3G341600v2 [Setaria italica]
MAPSPRMNLSAAAAVLLLVIVTAELGAVAGNFCPHLSGSFDGLCLNDFACADTCRKESSDNITGVCSDFPPRCYCFNCQAP